MTKIRKHITVCLFYCHLFHSVRGQDVKVTSSFDSARIYIGDQIKFTVTIDKPEGLNLQFPVFKDTIIKNIEILSGPVIDSSRAEWKNKNNSEVSDNII